MLDGKFITSEEFADGINENCKLYATIKLQCYPATTTRVGKVKLLIKKIDTTKSTNSSDYPTWVSSPGYS